MRIAMPPLRERRVIHRHLSAFFREHREADFTAAIKLICAFYELKPPRVEWFERLGHGKFAGQCYENGTIHLLTPAAWKRGRKYNSEKQWVNAVYHEIGHLYFYTDAEAKADAFAEGMERGL